MVSHGRSDTDMFSYVISEARTRVVLVKKYGINVKWGKWGLQLFSVLWRYEEAERHKKSVHFSAHLTHSMLTCKYKKWRYGAFFDASVVWHRKLFRYSSAEGRKSLCTHLMSECKACTLELDSVNVNTVCVFQWVKRSRFNLKRSGSPAFFKPGMFFFLIRSNVWYIFLD